MELKHHDLFIPNDGSDPFINCKLERRQYSKVLTEIITYYKNGFVLAINNKWGEGKTTFMRMWQQYLKNEKYKTLYYNAWENDFENDVLIALISELSEIENKPEKEFKLVLKKVLPLLGKILPSILKNIVKRKIGDDAVADIAESLGDYTENQLNEATEKYIFRKKSINDFKSTLESFVNKLSDDKPLVFIIDELDRCRPNYAVEVLEQIKHLFSVKGIVFVLSIDKIQLGNAVRGVYGSDLIDADEYLRRFIDIEFKIPKPNTQFFIDYLYEYYSFDDFVGSKGRITHNEFKNDKSQLKTIAQLLYSKGEFRLRHIEKAFSRIRLTFNTFSKDMFLYPEILILISFLDIYSPNTLEKIRYKKYKLQDLANELEKILLPFSDTTNIRKLRYLIASFLSKYENETLTAYNTRSQGLIKISKNDLNISTRTLGIKSRFENENNDLLQAILHYRNNIHISDIKLSFILKRYDLTENFRLQ